MCVSLFCPGCMLCFGQSAFFRFNHPEEAFRMKSMVPQGGGVSAGDYRLCPGTVWSHTPHAVLVFSQPVFAQRCCLRLHVRVPITLNMYNMALQHYFPPEVSVWAEWMGQIVAEQMQQVGGVLEQRFMSQVFAQQCSQWVRKSGCTRQAAGTGTMD